MPIEEHRFVLVTHPHVPSKSLTRSMPSVVQRRKWDGN